MELKRVTLDCTKMTGPEEIHDLFSQTLDFPAHYGRNLDALYDVLSTCAPLELTLCNAFALSGLFRYGDNLLLALQDAHQANPDFTLILA